MGRRFNVECVCQLIHVLDARLDEEIKKTFFPSLIMFFLSAGFSLSTFWSWQRARAVGFKKLLEII
jgi:hypothetical protein